MLRIKTLEPPAANRGPLEKRTEIGVHPAERFRFSITKKRIYRTTEGATKYGTGFLPADFMVKMKTRLGRCLLKLFILR
jgi:hypothetical protein